MTAQPTDQDNLSSRNKAAILIGLLLLFIAAGYWFLAPWLPRQAFGGEFVDQFSTAQNGQSSQFQITNEAGEIIGRESHNISDLPNFAMLDLVAENDDLYSSLSYLLGFDPQGIGLVSNYNDSTLRFSRQAIQRVDQNGNVVEIQNYVFVKTELGQHLLLNYENEIEAYRVFTPPIPQWPSETVSSTSAKLDQNGLFPQSKQSYASKRSLTRSEEISAEWQSYQPCVLIDQELALPEAEEALIAEQLVCNEVGLVSEKRFDTAGNLIETKTLLSTSVANIGQNPIDAWSTKISSAPDQSLPENIDVSNWELTRFAKLPIFGFAGQPSQPLTAFDNPSLLISARTNGPVVALNPETAEIEWSLTTANTVYGQPARHPTSGIIYFGSSSKRLLAVSADGMYLDSFQTEDSIVTRPVFDNKTVFFGSEDGYIYCVPSNLNPTQTRSLHLVNPVAGSPALVSGLAIFGTDSGTLTAVNAQCEPVWQFEAEDPVDAPLTLGEDGIVYFAGYSQIGALDGETGDEVWTTSIESSIHAPPILTEDLVLTVDLDLRLKAYDRQSGKLLWSNADFKFIGAPLIVGKHFLLSSDDGHLNLFDFTGTVTQRWPLAPLQIESDTQETHPLFSPVITSGSIWIIDTGGVIYQLAPQEN